MNTGIKNFREFLKQPGKI